MFMMIMLWNALLDIDKAIWWLNNNEDLQSNYYKHTLDIILVDLMAHSSSRENELEKGTSTNVCSRVQLKPIPKLGDSVYKYI